MTGAPASGDASQPVKLLWTGGWDSTYRLLEVVCIEGRAVQPYYTCIERQSGGLERRAMEAVLERLSREHPAARRLVLEPIFIAAPEALDAALWEALSELREMCGRRRIGWQYYDLAAAAEHFGLERLELGIERKLEDSEDRSFWYERLCASVVEDESGRWRLGPDPAPVQLEIFRRFSFPLLSFSKKEMSARAATAGFAELLELTWFCHTPDRRDRPCGMCSPCRQTLEQGLGRRIPMRNRIRHGLLWPIVSLLSRHRVRHRGRIVWQRLKRAVAQAASARRG